MPGYRDASDDYLIRLSRRSVCAVGRPACPQVGRCTGLSWTDREFLALTGRSDTNGHVVYRRARQLALDQFKPGLGDVAIVLAFTGLRWEEAVAVPIGNVNMDGQSITIDRTASESGGRRDVHEDMKTRAAERTVMIPDIAMPAGRCRTLANSPIFGSGMFQGPAPRAATQLGSLVDLSASDRDSP